MRRRDFLRKAWVLAGSGLLVPAMPTILRASGLVIKRKSSSVGAGTITKVNSNRGVTNNPSATQCSVVLTGVTSGNLIVVWTCAGTGNTATVSVSDGDGNFNAGTETVNASVRGRFHWDLSAKSGTVTYTATYTDVQGYPTIHVTEFSFGGSSATWLYDTANQTSGSGTTEASGNITTVASNVVCFFGTCEEGGPGNVTSPTIGGVAASVLPEASDGWCMFYRIASVSAGGASATKASGNYCCNLLAVKAT